jgi:hypothetical protein
MIASCGFIGGFYVPELLNAKEPEKLAYIIWIATVPAFFITLFLGFLSVRKNKKKTN